MISDDPKPNGDTNGDGRDGRGRFTRGNPGGPGNPNAAEASKHRAEFWRSIRTDDVAKCLALLRKIRDDEKAKTADRLIAARELLDRIIGRAVPSDLLERIEKIEADLAAREHHRDVEGRN